MPSPHPNSEPSSSPPSPGTRLPNPPSLAGPVPPPPPGPPPPPITPRAVPPSQQWEVDRMRTKNEEEKKRNEKRDKKSKEPFEPCHMFFYGSLMDPEVIQRVLNLLELPTTRPATISGFQVKMWDPYPTLVPGSAGKVDGCVWEVASEEHFKRLEAYESSAYTWEYCEAVLEDGSKLKGCRTFCWAGDPNSKDLSDGSFDLEHYQKNFKLSFIKRR